MSKKQDVLQEANLPPLKGKAKGFHVLRKFKQRDIEQERRQMDKLLPVNVEIDKEDLDALAWLPVDTQTKLKWIDEIIREKSAIK